MPNLSNTISDALAKDEFTSYAQFENEVLNSHGESPLLSVLSTSLRVTSVGQAFSMGYRGALQCLLPSLDSTKWSAFCVSETSGSHPKKIETTVSSAGVLYGDKSFVSMADSAEQLIVIAVAGYKDDRPELKAVLVNLPSEHVKLTVMPRMKMMPDVKHGKIQLDGAKGTVLLGDGHTDYNKKFRTIEDAHLLTAFTGLILSKTIRYNLDDKIIDDCMVIISSLLALDFNDSPWNTFHLNGAYELASHMVVLFENDIKNLPQNFQSDWGRDKKILSMTAKSRLAKREKAVNLLR
jgi:acyl-CoA dehydrogenase